MLRRRDFISLILSFFGALVSGYLQNLKLLIGGGIVLVVFVVLLSKKFSSKKRGLFMIAFLMMWILGGLRGWQVDLGPSFDDISRFGERDQDVILVGLVDRRIQLKQDSQRIILEVIEVKQNEFSENVTGNVLITVALYPRWQPGDRIEVTGKLERADRDNNYAHYLSLFDVYALMRYPTVKLLREGEFWQFGRFFYELRLNLVEMINLIYPEPAAALAAGMILGGSSGLADEIVDKMNLAGLSHLIVVSGYNITLVILAATFLFGFLPKRLRLVVIILLLVIFVLIVGTDSAVVRAALMGLIGILALWYERQSQLLISIMTVAFVMTVYEPRSLFYDQGFKLSFAATAGVCYLAPYLKKIFLKWGWGLMLAETIAVSLGAQVAVMPILLVHFGRFSLWAPVANLLVAPVLGLAQGLTVAALGLSFLSLPLSRLIGYPGFWCLKWVFVVADWFG